MKRLFIIAAAALASMALLSSCGGKEEPEPKEFGWAEVTMSFSLNEDLYNSADVKLNITKMDGTTSSYDVTKTSQTITVDKFKGILPATFSYAYDAVSKGTLTKDTYDIKLFSSIKIEVYDKNGKLLSDLSSKDDSENKGIKKDAFIEYLSFFSKSNSAKYTIGADFKIQ